MMMMMMMVVDRRKVWEGKLYVYFIYFNNNRMLKQRFLRDIQAPGVFINKCLTWCALVGIGRYWLNQNYFLVCL